MVLVHLKCKQYIPLPPQNWLDRRQKRPHAAMDLDAAPPELTTEMCKALAEHVRCNPGQASLPGDEGFEYRATIHQCLWALDGIIEDANDKAMFDQGLTHSRLRRRKMEKVEMLLNILLAVRYSKSRDRKAVAQPPPELIRPTRCTNKNTSDTGCLIRISTVILAAA